MIISSFNHFENIYIVSFSRSSYAYSILSGLSSFCSLIPNEQDWILSIAFSVVDLNYPIFYERE